MDYTYKDIWRCLNQTDLKPISPHFIRHQSKSEFTAVLQFFQSGANSKIINLRTLGREDHSYLARNGISAAHLFRNLEKTITGRHLDALEFQLNAVKNKAIYAICPLTGKLVESNQSLLANIHTIFYRFQGEQVFYIITAGMGEGFRKSALYFPDEELIVTTGDLWSFEQHDLFELKARVVSNFISCQKYLSDYNGSNRRTVVCLGVYHFAHHLWNELSGVLRLQKKKLVGKVDKFLLLREPLGDVEQIFPEIPTEKIERKNSISAIFQHILANNYFVVRIGGDFITRDLVNRVYRVAKKNCLRKTVDDVRNARRKHRPLLWVGIRVGSRTWSNQVDGLSNLITSLHGEFPRLGVVFDGFSLPGDKSHASSDNEEYGEILKQENEVVSDIVKKLKGRPGEMPEIINIVGSSIFDANVWAHTIDFYLSPYGTLQHKVGWLANKPGIIHTNRTLLENPANYIWGAMESSIRPRYVGRARVEDERLMEVNEVIYSEVSEARENAGILAGVKRVQGNPEFNNYDLDWKVLYEELLDIIRAPSVTHSLSGSRFFYRAKAKLKKAVRGLTSKLDPCKI